MLKRLQKILSEAGVCSRREAERWLLQGRLAVNGRSVSELGTKADPARDRITIDGLQVKIGGKKVYFLFHKPQNVMVTRKDPEGRPTIYDYLGKIEEGLWPVGRLDFDSEGLLLLTNDGDLTFEWTHPKSKVPKTYEVKVAGIPSKEKLEQLQKGIALDWGTTEPAAIVPFKQTEKNCWLRVTLTEGKNRQIRKMIEAVGHQVLRLRRTAIGSYTLGRLKPGAIQRVSPPLKKKKK